MTLCLNITTNSQKSLQKNIKQFIVDTNWYVNNIPNKEWTTAFVDENYYMITLIYDNV